MVSPLAMEANNCLDLNTNPPTELPDAASEAEFDLQYVEPSSLMTHSEQADFP